MITPSPFVAPSPFAAPGRRAHQAAPYDLLVRGGEVLDPSQGLRAVRDVAFAYGRVAAVVEPGAIDPKAARSVLDATGKLVTPGLVDLHAHVYVGGAELALPADEVCAAGGCTTVVDAGTAGANSMLGLYRLAHDAGQTRTRVYAFVHISSIGLVGHPHGESRDLTYLEPELAAQCLLRYPGFVLGVKVRQTAYIVGANGLEPLRRAIRAAALADAALADAALAAPAPSPDVDQAAGAQGPAALQSADERPAPASGVARPAAAQNVQASARSGRRVPVMVHIGGAPASIGELLSLLRPGDIVTHCFTGNTNGVVDASGRVEEACRQARARGVLFDVGHGSGSFAEPVARAAVEQGFWPDTISTDLHSGSVNEKAVDLPTTMSKFLSFGMPLEEVVARATVAPAQVINACLPAPAREPLLGTLQAGAPGDAAILEVQQGEFTFMDARRFRWTGRQRLVAVHTILKGRPWGRPYPQPYLVP
jgi:dihydroorotase